MQGLDNFPYRNNDRERMDAIIDNVEKISERLVEAFELIEKQQKQINLLADKIKLLEVKNDGKRKSLSD